VVFSQTNAAQVPSTISATANMLISKYFYLIERSGMTFALPLFKRSVKAGAGLTRRVTNRDKAD
jgi:hypothetical protein